MTTDDRRPTTCGWSAVSGRSSVVGRVQVAQLFGAFAVFLMGIIGSALGLELDS